MVLIGSQSGKKRNEAFKHFIDDSLPDYHERAVMTELEVCRAHAKMLLANEILNEDEYESVCKHVKSLEQDFFDGRIRCPGTYYELFYNFYDEHFSALVGIGEKLKIGRNPKDQYVLSLKLLVRKECQAIQSDITATQQALLGLCKRYFNAIIPGFNHSQLAVPNLLSNYFMAYYFMLERDYQRFLALQGACSVMPIGVDVGLEQLIPLDRTALLEMLEMEQVTHNNIDAVSDRDFTVEFHGHLATTMTHLSRLSEEMILWSTEALNYVEIPDGYCFGNDTLPFRRTPDVFEMIRAKASRVIGALATSYSMYRALPMGQQSDYESERQILFDSVHIVRKSLTVAAEVIKELRVNVDRAFNDVVSQHGLSFVLVEYLVRKSVPLGDVKKTMAELIHYCKGKNVGFDTLIAAEFQQFSNHFGDDIADIVDVDRIFNQDAGGLGKISKNDMLTVIEKAESVIKKRLDTHQK